MIFCGLKDHDNTYDEPRRSSPRISLFFLASFLKTFGPFFHWDPSQKSIYTSALVKLSRVSFFDCSIPGIQATPEHW